MTCFKNLQNATAYTVNTVLDRSYDVSPNLTDSENRARLVSQQEEVNALYQAAQKICIENLGDLPRYMGTSDVVRDINYLTSLLDGKDALMYVRNLY